MSDSSYGGRRGRVRAAIRVFLQDRLAAKLDALADDDHRRPGLIAQHEPAAWLSEAARQASQIQLVTHALKPLHPDARGTSLHVPPEKMPQRAEVGSHCLRAGYSRDVVGNAAALGVYKLLRLVVDGQTLLAWLEAGDAEAIAALSDDPEEAAAWRAAFVGITQSGAEGPATHTRAKQVYWLVGEDPVSNEDFHLLFPLFPTSLAHELYAVIQDVRFGEGSKAARQARREQRWHDGAVREYPDLAAQKLGGTKPQNVSQLNSERRGINYLLSSLPPRWRSRDVRIPFHTGSVFGRIYGGREVVRETVRGLREFLKSDPPANVATRERVSGYLDVLIDELVCLASEYQRALEPGWTRDARCELHWAERLWLDPYSRLMAESQAAVDGLARAPADQDWPGQIGSRFAAWVNHQLQENLPVGDIEHRHWRRELLADERLVDWRPLSPVSKDSLQSGPPQPRRE